MRHGEVSEAGRRWLCPLLLVVLLSPTARREALPRAESGAAPDPLAVALDHLYNLEFDAAQRELEAWLSGHPEDLRALNYFATVLLQREMFRRELLESQVYGKGGEAFLSGSVPLPVGFREQLLGILGKAESLADARLRRNPRDEEALYWAGVTHVTRAIFQLTLLRAHLAALGEAKQARKHHAQLLQINPRFTDALLVIGTYDYVVGSLPWYVKVLASIVGHRGNRERGLAEIKRVTEEGRWAREDAKSYLAILYFREKRHAEALELLQGLAEAYPRNVLLQQEIARVYKAQGDWVSAARVYDFILTKHAAGAPGFVNLPLAKILFQCGEVWQRAGDREQALERFDSASQLKVNDLYVYRADLSAAGLYLEMDRRAEAARRYQRVADAIPHTSEGRAAREKLKRLEASRASAFRRAS